MPNKVIVTSLSHLDTFRTRCQNGGKQWKLFIGQRQSSKQNGKVCTLLNVFLAIHFHFYVFPTPGFSSFWYHRYTSRFLPKSPGFFFTLISRFWSFGVERSARGPLFKWTHIKRTPYIILSEWMAHFLWRPSSHFYCKTRLYSGEHQLRSRGYPQNYRFHCRWGW